MKRGDLHRYLNDTKEKAFIHGSKFYILAVLLFSNEAELLLNKKDYLSQMCGERSRTVL